MKSIFISSTFKDMQVERDILHQRVFPKIRERLAAYGENVQELDLRWGVDTTNMSEEESGSAVIESCIDSIDRCKPYMVVLLGNRYGWIPDEIVLENIEDERITSRLNEKSSITQLEIAYGALSEKADLEKCIFCFREMQGSEHIPEERKAVYEAESPLHEEKQRNLKEDILSREGANVFRYKAIWNEGEEAPEITDEFEKQITEQLWDVLKKELPSAEAGQAVNREEQVLKDAALTAQRYLTAYVVRSTERDGAPGAMPGRSAVWYYGEGGCGKSAMMAKIAEYAGSVGCSVFLYYAGNKGCYSANTLLSVLLYWLKKNNFQGIQMDPYEEGQILTEGRKKELISDALVREQPFDYVLLIDGADQMEQDALAVLKWLSQSVIKESKTWHGLIVTSTATYEEEVKNQLAGYYNCREIPQLGYSEADAVIRAHAAWRGKRLDETVVDCIRRKKASRNPLALSLILQKLFMMNRSDFEEAERLERGMGGLSQFMRQQVETLPDEVGSLTVSALADAAKKLSWNLEKAALPGRLSPADPSEIFMLLALSRDGLTSGEIEELLRARRLGCPTAYLEQMFSYLYDSFGMGEEGNWNFRHRLLKESFLESRNAEEIAAGYEQLFRFYSEKEGCGGESFYYAWKRNDAKAAAACLRDLKNASAGEKESLYGSLRQVFSSPADDEFVRDFIAACGPEEKDELVLFVIRAGEEVLEWPEAAQKSILLLQPEDTAPDISKFYFRTTQILPAYAGIEKQRKIKAFLDAEAVHNGLRSVDPAAEELFACGCGLALLDQDTREVWDRAKTELERYCDGSGRQNERIVRFLRSNEAMRLIDAKEYDRCDGVMKGLLSELETQYLRTGSMIDLLHYLNGLQTKASVSLPEKAIPLLKRGYDLCDEKVSYNGQWLDRKDPRIKLKATAVPDRLRLLFVQICTLLFHATRDKETAYDINLENLLDRGILETEILSERTGDLSDVLRNEFLTLRYQRTLLHAKESKYWEEDDRQRKDYQEMEEGYQTIFDHSKTLPALLNLNRVSLEELRYCDRSHKGREVFDCAKKLLPLANMLGAQNNMPAAAWAALADYLEIAEDLWRYRYCKSAAGFTTDIYRMFGKIDANWLQQGGHVLEYRCRTVRYYLMEARKGLMEGENVETALAYIVKASELLEYKEGDRNSLPRSVDGLRSETWILFGELLDKSGKGDSAADALDKTDRYWIRKKAHEIFADGNLPHYIRYCRGLALRARKRNNPEYMNRAVENLSYLVRYYTEDRNAALWPDLYDRLMDACRFYWFQNADHRAPSTLMTAILPALYDKKKHGVLSGEEGVLLEKYALEEQKGVPYYGLDGETLPDKEWLKMVADVQEDDCGKLRAGCRLAVEEMLSGRFDYAAKGGYIPQTASTKNCGNYFAEGILIREIAFRIAAAAENEKKTDAATAGKGGTEKLTPLAEQWLQTEEASEEPFVAEWIRILGMYADSLNLENMSDSGDFELCMDYARKVISVLSERIEKLSRKEKLGDTGLPSMILSMGKSLVTVKEQGITDLPDEQYIEVLKSCERAAALGMHTDVRLNYAPAHEIRRDIFWTLKGAEVYRRLGDIRRNTFWYLEALRWFLHMMKQEKSIWQTQESTAQPSQGTAQQMLEDTNTAWETCQILLKQVHAGDVTDHRRLMEIIDVVADVSAVVCRLTGEESGVSEACKEVMFFRDNFTNKGDEDFAKVSGYLRKVSYAYLAWAQQAGEGKHPTALKWLPVFLDACSCQIETLNIQSSDVWDEILQELHACKVNFPEETGRVSRLIGQVAEERKKQDTNLHYLAMQGVRDLGSEATAEDFLAYVERRNAGMPSSLGRPEA